jgi:ADP-ribose pyrophosphatase YjhB (NUDIX family)
MPPQVVFDEISTMMSTWLSDEAWKQIQASVPVACIDVLPLRVAGGAVREIGLIHRDTPHQGRRWCLVGGRLLRNESLAEAVGRQLRETLGSGVRFALPVDAQPAYVAQYFTSNRPDGPLDPRQHAIGMTFAVAIEGEPRPAGEAHAFQWFATAALPPADAWGFEQDRVARSVLARLRG